MEKQKLNLNLGAGNDVQDPKKWINHDLRKFRKEIEVTWDLNKLPWPWENNSMERINAKAVFEHIDIDLLKAVDECWRILKPKGILYLKLPNAEDYIGCWLDPTHRRPYHLGGIAKIFDYKSESTGNNFYTARKWKIIRKGTAGKQNKDGVWSSIFAEMEKYIG